MEEVVFREGLQPLLLLRLEVKDLVGEDLKGEANRLKVLSLLGHLVKR